MLERKLGLLQVHVLGLLLRLENWCGWGEMLLLLEVYNISLLLSHRRGSLLLLCREELSLLLLLELSCDEIGPLFDLSGRDDIFLFLCLDDEGGSILFLFDDNGSGLLLLLL